jgi:hypothetical protein
MRPSFLEAELAMVNPGKDAGRRNECYDGLLFPPERLRVCHVAEERQSEISNFF